MRYIMMFLVLGIAFGLFGPGMWVAVVLWGVLALIVKCLSLAKRHDI